MIADDTLLFFIDVMPTEQGVTENQDYFCYTACAISKWDSRAHSTKKYKDQTRKQRREYADLLCMLIKSEELFLLPACVVTRQEDARVNGERLLRHVLGLSNGEAIVRASLEAAGFDLPVSRAMYYANYVTALTFLGRRGAWYAKNMGLKKVQFVLDLLPGDSRDGPQPGLEALKRIVDGSPFLRSMWIENAADFQLSQIGFAYASRGDYAGDVMVDWLAQSYHAAINTETFKLNIRKKREERRRSAAGFLFALLEKFKEKWNQKFVEPFILSRISGGFDKSVT